MSYIQLPDKIVKHVDQIQLNVPKDKKTRDLFAHLPYIANLKDLILQNKVEDLLRNRSDLQDYLLATKHLGKTLEDSLQLAVSHGKLNEGTKARHLSELNDPKYKYFRENDNPLDVAYRQKAKFDIQNPIIGELLQQINKSKPEEDDFKRVKKQLQKAPDTKDFALREKFNKIFERDDRKKDNVLDPFHRGDNDDDDSPPGSPGVLPPPPMDFDFDNFDQQNVNPFNVDLNSLEQDCYNRDIPINERTEKINLDRNLREIFPDPDEAIALVGQENDTYSDFADQLDRDEIPEELELITGGSNQARSLFSKLDSYKLIDRGNEDFVNYLGTEECQRALERERISIHVPTGSIFVNNENTGESLYSFLENQQDETKKKYP